MDACDAFQARACTAPRRCAHATFDTAFNKSHCRRATHTHHVMVRHLCHVQGHTRSSGTQREEASPASAAGSVFLHIQTYSAVELPLKMKPLDIKSGGERRRRSLMGARRQLASIVRCSCGGEMPPVVRGGSSAQQTSSSSWRQLASPTCTVTHHHTILCRRAMRSGAGWEELACEARGSVWVVDAVVALAAAHRDETDVDCCVE